MGQPGYSPSRWLRRLVHQRDNETCQLCGAVATPLHVAHRIPWPVGPTEEANLYLLCRSCNGRDRPTWAADARWQAYEFPQTHKEFATIRDTLLERVLP